jgi:hypothetical protein
MQREQDVLAPLVALLSGQLVPYDDAVAAGRKLASVLVRGGKPLSLSADGPWAGVWDLEELTDVEAIAWGMWGATRLVGGPPKPVLTLADFATAAERLARVLGKGDRRGWTDANRRSSS